MWELKYDVIISSSHSHTCFYPLVKFRAEMPRTVRRSSGARAQTATSSRGRKLFMKKKTRARRTKARRAARLFRSPVAMVSDQTSTMIVGQGETSVMPERQTATLTYDTLRSFSAGETSLGVEAYAFRANGLYDPDVTGTGHQPYGFDQYMVLYQRYKVLRSRITVSFAPSGDNDANEVVVYGIYRNAITTLPVGNAGGSNLEAVMESPYSNYVVTTNSNTSQIKSVSSNFSLRRDLPFKADDLLSTGQQGADPEAPYYFVIWFGGLGDTESAPQFHATIEYDVEFTQPQTLVQS